MKLTQKQIEEIKKLREEGKTIAELSRMFKVQRATIKHHTDASFREYQKTYQRKWYKNMSEERKKEYFERKKKYQREYHKRRYNEDEEFRKKHLKLMKGGGKDGNKKS